MKKHNPVDELFHRRLSGHESQVPVGMFERIQSVRKQGGTPAVIPPWLLAAAASVLLLVVAFSWGYQQGKQDQTSLSHFPIAMEQATDVQPASTPEEETLAAIENPTHKTDIQTTTISDSNLDIQNPTASANLKTTSLPFVSPIEDTKTPTVVRMPQEATTWLNNLQEPSFPISPSAIAESSLQPTLNSTSIPEFASIDGIDFMAEDESLEEALLGSLSNSPKCAKFSTRSWHFDLDLMAGPAYGFHTLEDRNPEGGEHLKHRRKTEQPTTSFSTQMRISALSPSGIAVRTGLAFTQLNNRFEYHNENEHTITYTDRLDANGNVIATDTIHLIGARQMVDHNRFRFIELPFQLGYEFRAGKLKLAVNAGASVNLLFAAKGTFLSPATDAPTSFASSNTEAVNTIPAYRTQIGAGLDASISLRYHLTGRYSLLIEPYVRHYTGSLTEQAYSLSHKATVSGINLGVRMRL